ncbi:hypothetical protein [Leptospira jelokensis]|uniref:Uncharacterized protein n=1 Tax=Leptospira jelokensis TaxID=2484931 RepID=A0A4Z0ZXW6_9LEPT|nr:hypothetical protein [Leptospira jelokensis]TGL58578.1 hypothetical protein EHQ62_16915 [Leptospira jelokensis]
MKEIILPKYVFDELFDFIEAISFETDEHDSVVFDFAYVENYSPVALVAIICRVKYLQSIKAKVYFRNHDSFRALTYFQRMNFFSICNLNMDEKFKRHDSNGNFQEIQEFGRLGGSVEKLSEGIALCCIPESERWKIDDYEENSEIYDLVVYAVSELINNVFQHSGSNGYISAQVYRKGELVRLGIAD